MNNGYHYFTSVDITNTDAFDVDLYSNRYDGTLYYQAIANSNKTPMFRTKIENELKSFELFRLYCGDDFGTIERKQMATLSLNKYSRNEWRK